jgi:hypothetical protein
MQWKAAISPHDDYKYADVCITNRLKELMQTRLFYWCAHRARNFYASRQNHFGDFTHWKSPYGD